MPMYASESKRQTEADHNPGNTKYYNEITVKWEKSASRYHESKEEKMCEL